MNIEWLTFSIPFPEFKTKIRKYAQESRRWGPFGMNNFKPKSNG